MNAKDKIDAVLNDPCATYWLQDALRTSLKRDILDAVRDANTLLNLLEAYYQENAKQYWASYRQSRENDEPIVWDPVTGATWSPFDQDNMHNQLSMPDEANI
jgi:hypothetical protein